MKWGRFVFWGGIAALVIAAVVRPAISDAEHGRETVVPRKVDRQVVPLLRVKP